MIRNMAGYARQSGLIDEGMIDDAIATLEAALKTNKYLVLAPQFVVTALR